MFFRQPPSFSPSLSLSQTHTQGCWEEEGRDDGEIEEQEDGINKEQNNTCALSDTGNEDTFSSNPMKESIPDDIW